MTEVVTQRSWRDAGAAFRSVDRDLQNGVRRAVRAAVKPAQGEVRREVIDRLPSGGGLNRWAARLTLVTSQTYSARAVSVTVRAQLRKRGGRTFGDADLRALNRGRVMHPRWGRGPLIGPQIVRGGWWGDVMSGPVAARAKAEIGKALDEVIADVARKADSR